MLLWAFAVVICMLTPSGAAWISRPTRALDGDKAEFVENSALHPRSVVNAHCLSGLVYLLGVVYACLERQWDFAVLMFFTWGSSSIYHTYREAHYYNLDFIFAMSMGLLFCWTLWLSTPRDYASAFSFSEELSTAVLGQPPLSSPSYCEPNETTFLFGCASFPMATFLFFLCGKPAEVVSLDADGFCLCRRDNKIYNIVHPIWHLFSGLGPFWMVNYFAHSCAPVPNVTLGLDDLVVPLLGLRLQVPAVITVILVVSLGINWLGNRVGIMPPM